MLWEASSSNHKRQSPETDNWVLAGEELLKCLFFSIAIPLWIIFDRIRYKRYSQLLCAWVSTSVFFLLFHYTFQKKAVLSLIHFLHLFFSNKFLFKLYLRQNFFFYGAFLYATLLVIALWWRIKKRKYEEGFESLGLKNSLGKTVKFLNDTKVDDDQRKLVIQNVGLSEEDVQKLRKRIEATFDFNVTDIRYGKSKKIIQIYYRKENCHTHINWSEFDAKAGLLPRGSFFIGLSAQGKPLWLKLKDMVHLLVAGETSGGKSTFLRQMLTTLMLRNETIHYLLIDLKGGIEFKPFSKVPCVQVVSSLNDAVTRLDRVNEELDRRLKLFEQHQVNELDEYNQKGKQKLPRIFVVIDECAELFLPCADDEKSRYHVKKTKEYISRLARLSRAAGIHLVLATQRPDRTAIDPQIKDNMVTRLCFKVNSDAASILVLGSGKATDLPPVKGRAIWKMGMEEIEVQVPYLSQEESKKLLMEHYGINDVPPDPSSQNNFFPLWEVPTE